MSEVSVLLQGRCLECPTVSGTVPLSDLRAGMRAVISGFREDVDQATGRRLVDLGFMPGTSVTMVRKAPLRDPVVYRVADYEIALRKVQAKNILVTTAA